MLYGIVDKIYQGLLDSHAVAIDRLRLCRSGLFEFQFDAPFRRARLHQFDRLLDEKINICRFKLIFFASLLDARKIQDVFDERREPARFLDKKTEILLLFDFSSETLPRSSDFRPSTASTRSAPAIRARRWRRNWISFHPAEVADEIRDTR